MDLQRWKLFRELDPSLTSVCKIAKIIHYPKVGFLVLQNDDVYAVTSTAANFKWLGNGCRFTEAIVNQASKVESLCGKGIINFYGSLGSLAALTEDGTVYSWTCDSGSAKPGAVVDGIPRKLFFLDANMAEVRQLSCGLFHTLCLSSDGETYGWGYDDCGQLGSGSKRDRGCDVTKISGFNDAIVQVAAGFETSFALDSLGRVWSWGHRQTLLLGYEASDDQLTPKLIDNLPKIKKIAVGRSHALALSETGKLYFWGKFYDEEITTKPLLIPNSAAMEPVVDIACAVDAQYAVCQAKNDVYIWGKWCQQRIIKPERTEFSSMDEAFACNKSPIMLQPLRVKAKPHRVADAWQRAFNDHSTANVLFSVENEVLHAHSLFLKLRSDYFRKMFDNEWEESKSESKAIKIQGFSFRTFKAYIYFLYHESLIEADMSVDDLTELMKAADYYGDEDLRLACEDELKTHLTPKNACSIYACAVRSNAERLQNYTVEFMVPLYKEVVNTAECAKLDSDMKTKLMIHFAKLTVFQVPPKRMIL